MRWISFFILAYLAVGLQTGVARAMEIGAAAPNLVLLAVVFVSINAPRDVALLGSFILGAMQDLTSQGTMGLYAFSYGLVAMFVVTAQQAVYREHPLTHFTMTLLGGLLTAAILAIHSWWRPDSGASAAASVDSPAIHLALVPLFYTALYTAILAPIVLGVLQRIKRLFHFQSNRSKLSSRFPQRRVR